MADNSRIVVTMARCLAIGHIIIGFLLLCFGIADGATTDLYDYYEFWVGSVYFGVWIGLWVLITGGLGIGASCPESTRTRRVFAAVFMGFSITSTVMGGVIIFFYSIVINFEGGGYNDGHGEYDARKRNIYPAKMAICAIILVLGILEFVISIWAAICCCMLKACVCCCVTQEPPQQFSVTGNPGYVITQGPHGFPVAVPVQASGDGNPVPVAAGFYPQCGQTVSEPPLPTGALPQQTDAPTYKLGKYIPLNEQA